MSDAVYPVLPGLAWSVLRTPQWSTNVQKSKSGRRYAVGDRLYPTWKWRLPYEFLRQYGSASEQAALVGFVNRHGGSRDSFLYRDPDDFIVSGQGFGTGDGVTTVFPLVRVFGEFVEPVDSCDTITRITVSGADASYGSAPGQWVIDGASPPNLAQVRFITPPAPGAQLTWSGTYYWRCAFLNDAIPFEQFMKGLWKTDIEFESFAP